MSEHAKRLAKALCLAELLSEQETEALIDAEFAEVVKKADDGHRIIKAISSICRQYKDGVSTLGEIQTLTRGYFERQVYGIAIKDAPLVKERDDLKKALGECLKICQALNKITVGPKGQAGVGKWVGNVMNLADDAAAIIPIAEKLLEDK